MTPNDFDFSSVDPKYWAAGFQQFIVDEGHEINEALMAAWFANAMNAVTQAVVGDSK